MVEANKNNRDENKMYDSVLSPLMAVGSGAALGFGLQMSEILTNPQAKATSSIYFRSGLSCGLFFLGVHSGFRTFKQQDEFGRVSCIAAMGSCIGASMAIDPHYCKKSMTFPKVSLSSVAKSSVAGGLIPLGLYGGVKALCLLIFPGPYH